MLLIKWKSVSYPKKAVPHKKSATNKYLTASIETIEGGGDVSLSGASGGSRRFAASIRTARCRARSVLYIFRSVPVKIAAVRPRTGQKIGKKMALGRTVSH